MSTTHHAPPDEQLDVRWPVVVAIGLAVLSLVVAVASLGRVRAATNDGPAVLVDAAAGGEAAEALPVSLSEFAIDPAEPTVAAGGSVEVRNDGGAEHNLVVEGQDLGTANLQPGDTEVLDVSSLPAGTYVWLCTIPGHATSGMTGTLTVADGADAGAEDPAPDTGVAHGGSTADAAAMQAAMVEAMQASIGAFPAETEGEGAAVLEPEVLPDGTKLFELVVDHTEWEVEPGKVVEAISYNGVVPGPTMFVDVGDRVTIRVVNEMDDQGTSLHPHGLRDHDFAIDGVTFISQDPIEPGGGSMDYTFDASAESVMTYHSHHMSLEQVPNGLFGAMVIGDYAGLAGYDDVVDEQVLVLNDAGNIGFSLNGKSFPATTPYVYESGDRVLVHYANEGQMAHPMHLHNQPGTVIAKDGFLLPEGARYQGDTFNVAPGERLSVVYEMGQPGTWVWHCHILSHVKRTDGTMFGMLTAVVVEDPEQA